MLLPPEKQDWFPNLSSGAYRVTSPEDWDYNCIAHAADMDAASVAEYFWWPDEDYFWPDGIPREETLEAFILAYQRVGYQPCENGDLEPGVQKVAIYVDQFRDHRPTHAARQLESGKWTSKLGPWEDIEHSTPDDVAGYRGSEARYGTVAQYLKRPFFYEGGLP